MKIPLNKGNRVVSLRKQLIAKRSFLDALSEVVGSQLGDRALVAVANIENKYQGSAMNASSR